MVSKTERHLKEARAAYAARAWQDAFRLLTEADAAEPLAPADLELLAWSASLTGRDPVLLATLERLHEHFVAAGQPQEAAWAAFWTGFRLLALGEMGRATAWLNRAQRHVGDVGSESVVSGYLLLPGVQQSMFAGDLEAAAARAATAVEIGERHGDSDLVAFARNLQGRALVRQGRIADGLGLLDEAMLQAASDELTPLVTGLVYCTVIATCCQIYAMDRAREWTEALRAWCRSQPQLTTFSGVCMAHRAEIMQMNGDWPEAIAEAKGAFEHLADTTDRDATAAACYQEGDIHRLRGDFAAAERRYTESSRFGHDPQPGMALLRLAQGRPDQAAAAIRRAVGAKADALLRARLLPAFVEIMLAVGAVEEADMGARQLEETAAGFETEVLGAMAAHARGAVHLARGEALEALPYLRRSFSTWQKVGAPYIAARLRVLIGRACRLAGDEDGAALELDAARAVFEELGAAPDLAALRSRDRPGRPHGLTRRELEVLRLLASGMTNRAMAEELCVSGKTVDRHVANIFDKLDVTSRAAATAYAYKQNLL